MSATSKTCRRCKEPKSLEQFRKAPTRFGGDGFSNDCKDCLAILRAERRAAAGVEQTSEAAEPVAPIPPEHQLGIPLCMPVVVVWDGTDFVLTQENEQAGEQTIYIAPHAMRRIWEFAEKLALQQQALEAASAVAA